MMQVGVPIGISKRNVAVCRPNVASIVAGVKRLNIAETLRKKRIVAAVAGGYLGSIDRRWLATAISLFLISL